MENKSKIKTLILGSSLRNLRLVLLCAQFLSKETLMGKKDGANG